MKVSIVHYQHSSNGLSLFVIPETENEREVLRALWSHGTLNKCNGVADRSGEGFAISWKVTEISDSVLAKMGAVKS